MQIDFRHNAQNITNLVRQIVHQFFVIAHADGYAVIVFADVNRAAAARWRSRRPISNIRRASFVCIRCSVVRALAKLRTKTLTKRNYFPLNSQNPEIYFTRRKAKR